MVTPNCDPFDMTLGSRWHLHLGVRVAQYSLGSPVKKLSRKLSPFSALPGEDQTPTQSKAKTTGFLGDYLNGDVCAHTTSCELFQSCSVPDSRCCRSIFASPRWSPACLHKSWKGQEDMGACGKRGPSTMHVLAGLLRLRAGITSSYCELGCVWKQIILHEPSFQSSTKP